MSLWRKPAADRVRQRQKRTLADRLEPDMYCLHLELARAQASAISGLLGRECKVCARSPVLLVVDALR